MGKIGEKNYSYAGREIKQIILKGTDDKRYFKSVPQTDVPMYGLNVKEDGIAHMYLYEPGGNEKLINGKKNPIGLNHNQILSKELKPKESWGVALSANTATCVVAARYDGEECEITVEQKENTKIITVSHPAEVFIALLDKNDVPILLDSNLNSR